MGSDYYEDRSILFEYLFFHYGEASDYLPYKFGPQEAFGFPHRVVERGLEGFKFQGASRALDIGCAVGRSAFELSRVFDEVVAVDFSHSFVEYAQKLQKEKKIEINVVGEVGKVISQSISLPEKCNPDRIRFFQGDAMNMSKECGKFNMVLAANLIDRLPHPQAFLEEVGEFLNPGGILVLSSPYTWMERFTPPNQWLNREKDNFSALREILEKDFQFLRKENISMLIREHIRKYQWTVSELTIWCKK